MSKKSKKSKYFQVTMSGIPLECQSSQIKILNLICDYFDLAYKYELTLDLLNRNPIGSFVASELDEHLHYRENLDDFLNEIPFSSLSSIENESLKNGLNLYSDKLKEGGYHGLYINSEDFMSFVTDINIFEIRPELFRLDIIIKNFNEIDVQNFMSTLELTEKTYTIKKAEPHFTFNYKELMKKEREEEVSRRYEVMQRRYNFLKEKPKPLQNH